MTSLTTLLAVLALVVAGGPVIRGFAVAMVWGIVTGTFSSIYVASPMVMHLRLPREAEARSPV